MDLYIEKIELLFSDRRQHKMINNIYHYTLCQVKYNRKQEQPLELYIPKAAFISDYLVFLRLNAMVTAAAPNAMIAAAVKPAIFASSPVFTVVVCSGSSG